MSCCRPVYHLLLFIGPLLVSCSYWTAPVSVIRESGAEPLVRVRLTWVGQRVAISSKAGLRVASGSWEQPVGRDQVVTVVWRDGVEVMTGGRRWRVRDTLSIRTDRSGLSDAEGMLNVGERSYRGRLLLFATDSELVVVNLISVEEYLYGVVPCEIGPITTETFEAVKAQAVAARSFTLTRLNRRQGLGFQLYDSYLRDQEYQGAGRETELARRAVDATRGEVLCYYREVAEALYHGNCGGRTVDGAQPYLRGVPDTPGHHQKGTPFCANSKSFRWQLKLPRDSLERSVARLAGFGTGRVRMRSFQIERDPKSGRVKGVVFQTGRGTRRISGSDLRFGLGLKSQWFEMKLDGKSVRFSGRGWGHGVGMCQDGACAMARQGYGYREILHHYYTGVTIRQVYR